MKKILIGLLALCSMTAFADSTLSVKHKVAGVYNVGSVANPEAQIQLVIKAVVSSPRKIQHENWILSLKADGTVYEVTSPSSKLTADYKVVEKLNLGTVKAPVKATLYRINVNYDSKTESLGNSSMVLVKENGEVQIIE